ncbi:MAG: hypothetical protein P8170_12905 [Gemmatimonadota bacterium]
MDAGARDRLRRWIRPLLRAYPRDFRDRYGRDLERTYLDWFRELRERGSRLAGARVLGLAFWHSMRDGLVERSGATYVQHPLPLVSDHTYDVILWRILPASSTAPCVERFREVCLVVVHAFSR